MYFHRISYGSILMLNGVGSCVLTICPFALFGVMLSICTVLVSLVEIALKLIVITLPLLLLVLAPSPRRVVEIKIEPLGSTLLVKFVFLLPCFRKPPSLTPINCSALVSKLKLSGRLLMD